MEEQQAKPVDKQKRSEYFEFKIPRPIITDISFSPLLILILIALSFLLGMQTSRLNAFNSELTKLQSVANGQNVAGAQAQQPQLGEKVNVSPGSLPTLGNKNAKVTMIEFSDFQCPFCKRFYDETFAQLKKDYIDTGKVRFAFRHAPLEIHPNAPKAAEGSECANDQKKFWQYHDVLFEQFDSWVNETPENLPTKLTSMAESIGLDGGTFSDCLNSDKYAGKVAKDAADGVAAGATATPTFFINGKILVGALPYESFKTLLDQELATQ
jgi:protein-disulfide isomerase